MTRALNQRLEARAILSAATPGPASDDLIWAVGVQYAQHPWNIVHAWRGDPLIGHELHSASLDNHLWITAASGRITIGTLDDPPIVRLDQSTVRRLIADTRRFPAGLVAEVRALYDERTAHGRANIDRYARYQRGEADRETDAERDDRFAQYCDIERRCDDAGARVWDHVRPQQRPEQLDLFAAFGGAR